MAADSAHSIQEGRRGPLDDRSLHPLVSTDLSEAEQPAAATPEARREERQGQQEQQGLQGQRLLPEQQQQQQQQQPPQPQQPQQSQQQKQHQSAGPAEVVVTLDHAAPDSVAMPPPAPPQSSIAEHLATLFRIGRDRDIRVKVKLQRTFGHEEYRNLQVAIRRHGGEIESRMGKADIVLVDVKNPVEARKLIKEAKALGQPLPVLLPRYVFDCIEAGDLQVMEDARYDPEEELKAQLPASVPASGSKLGGRNPFTTEDRAFVVEYFGLRNEPWNLNGAAKEMAVERPTHTKHSWLSFLQDNMSTKWNIKQQVLKWRADTGQTPAIADDEEGSSGAAQGVEANRQACTDPAHESGRTKAQPSSNDRKPAAAEQDLFPSSDPVEEETEPVGGWSGRDAATAGESRDDVAGAPRAPGTMPEKGTSQRQPAGVKGTVATAAAASSSGPRPSQAPAVSAAATAHNGVGVVTEPTVHNGVGDEVASNSSSAEIEQELEIRAPKAGATAVPLQNSATIKRGEAVTPALVGAEVVLGTPLDTRPSPSRSSSRDEADVSEESEPEDGWKMRQSLIDELESPVKGKERTRARSARASAIRRRRGKGAGRDRDSDSDTASDVSLGSDSQEEDHEEATQGPAADDSAERAAGPATEMDSEVDELADGSEANPVPSQEAVSPEREVRLDRDGRARRRALGDGDDPDFLPGWRDRRQEPSEVGPPRTKFTQDDKAFLIRRLGELCTFSADDDVLHRPPDDFWTSLSVESSRHSAASWASHFKKNSHIYTEAAQVARFADQDTQMLADSEVDHERDHVETEGTVEGEQEVRREEERSEAERPSVGEGPSAADTQQNARTGIHEDDAEANAGMQLDDEGAEAEPLRTERAAEEGGASFGSHEETNPNPLVDSEASPSLSPSFQQAFSGLGERVEVVVPLPAEQAAESARRIPDPSQGPTRRSNRLAPLHGKSAQEPATSETPRRSTRRNPQLSSPSVPVHREGRGGPAAAALSPGHDQRREHHDAKMAAKAGDPLAKKRESVQAALLSPTLEVVAAFPQRQGRGAARGDREVDVAYDDNAEGDHRESMALLAQQPFENDRPAQQIEPIRDGRSRRSEASEPVRNQLAQAHSNHDAYEEDGRDGDDDDVFESFEDLPDGAGAPLGSPPSTSMAVAGANAAAGRRSKPAASRNTSGGFGIGRDADVRRPGPRTSAGVPVLDRHRSAAFHDFTMDSDEEDRARVASGGRRNVVPSSSRAVNASRFVGAAHGDRQNVHDPRSASLSELESRQRVAEWATRTSAELEAERAAAADRSAKGSSSSRNQIRQHNPPKAAVLAAYSSSPRRRAPDSIPSAVASGQKSKEEALEAKQRYLEGVKQLCSDFGLGTPAHAVRFLKPNGFDVERARQALSAYVAELAASYGVTPRDVVEFVRTAEGKLEEAEKYMRWLANSPSKSKQRVVSGLRADPYGDAVEPDDEDERVAEGTQSSRSVRASVADEVEDQARGHRDRRHSAARASRRRTYSFVEEEEATEPGRQNAGGGRTQAARYAHPTAERSRSLSGQQKRARTDNPDQQDERHLQGHSRRASNRSVASGASHGETTPRRGRAVGYAQQQHDLERDNGSSKWSSPRSARHSHGRRALTSRRALRQQSETSDAEGDDSGNDDEGGAERERFEVRDSFEGEAMDVDGDDDLYTEEEEAGYPLRASRSSRAVERAALRKAEERALALRAAAIEAELEAETSRRALRRRLR